MTIEPISAHEQSPAHPASRGHSEVVVWPGVFVRKLVRRAALETCHFILTCRLGSDEEGTMGRRWTDQDIEDLKRMAQYYSAPKIAELTNRTAGVLYPSLSTEAFLAVQPTCKRAGYRRGSCRN